MNHKSEIYQKTLKDQIIFEIISWYGRTLLTRKPPRIDSSNNLLHLGSGSNMIDGWINADFYRPRYWRVPKSLWMLDFRFKLYCDSDYWDGIFTEHTLEHLNYVHIRNLLNELFRTLKPRCWIRISVPDLRKYVDYYNNKPSHQKFSQWVTGAEAISSLTQGWGHLSVWDNILLERTLLETGFINVREVDFLQGTDKRLLMDKEVRNWESLYFEGQKP